MNDSNCTQNTINPSELNLWRVIRKNDNGTVDVVSEYVSSNSVFFYGKTGYLNYIGALNTIASQYINTKYVSKARNIGYSNQIEKCTEFSETGCPTDTGYETDTNLVKQVIGQLGAKNPSGTNTMYWLASRDIYNGVYRVNYIKLNTAGLDAINFFSSSTGRENGRSYSVRPILTLKGDIQIKSGDGQSASTAYQLT